MSAPPHADPGRGVFETMLVLDGRPVELDAHLERLSASLASLYGAELPAAARVSVVDRARTVRHGKLRLTVTPARDGLRMRIATDEIAATKVFPRPEQGAALRSFVVAGGLGSHKWADRRLLESSLLGSSPGELPLLLDADGSALETSRGSVFCATPGGCLATPPTDGRILPSIARRRAIEVAVAEGIETRERRLTLDDLRGAEEVFLAGSVRGVEPVRTLDGAELAHSGRLSAPIAAGLRRRWLLVPQGEPVAAVAGARRGDRPAR